MSIVVQLWYKRYKMHYTFKATWLLPRFFPPFCSLEKSMLSFHSANFGQLGVVFLQISDSFFLASDDIPSCRRISNIFDILILNTFVLICHSSPCNEVHVSAFVFCVRNDFKSLVVRDPQSVSCDAQFVSVIIYKVGKYIMPSALKSLPCSVFQPLL